MIKRVVASLLLYGASISAQNPSAASSAGDPWKSLQFLVGTWEAKTQGGSAGAASSGTYTFQLELRSHVLARHSINSGCKGPADFDCEHGDLLYVYEEPVGRALKAIYFDNEGHVINYEVTTPAPNTAILLSPASQPGPQFRLVYELKGRVMLGKFQMRMPGQSDFKSYLEWSGERK